MTTEDSHFLGRIAEALERQVAQTDESVARQNQWREENIKMHADDKAVRHRQHEAELEEVRQINSDLLTELRRALTKVDGFMERLAVVERALSADARLTPTESGKA